LDHYIPLDFPPKNSETGKYFHNTARTCNEGETIMVRRKTFCLDLAVVAASIGLACWTAAVQASTITLNASDTGSQSSFIAGTNWSDGAAPSSGNDYVVSGYNLRTSGTTGSYVFAGKSLTITNSGQLLGKEATSGTDTVSNLILDNGTVANYQGGTATWTVAGSITLASGGGTFVASTDTSVRYTHIIAAISGVGALTVSANSSNGSYVSLEHSNTYSGGTSLLSNATLYAETDGALGTGNVTVSGTLKLENGSTNNYIADTASLVVNSGGAVILNYTGADVISGLTVNGVTYGAGTYGGAGSGAATIISAFSGNGTLTVVPEPATTGLVLIGLGGLLAYAWRKRRKN
jgi:hypothetical protein